MPRRLHDALMRAWRDGGPLAWALAPLSWLYGALVRLRQALYRRGWLASATLPVPVLVVGNVLAGGAGKTPVVLALVGHLRARGLRVGVVSRGHGRRTQDCREVRPDSPALEVGDEPALIRRRLPVPVFVARRRAEAAQALLAQYPDTQLLVCDDGLQHLALRADLRVCVFDERGLGNGRLLPAGPLREPWPRPVELVLSPQPVSGPAPWHRVQRALEPEAVRADGQRATLASLRGRHLLAVAGIARPEAFFTMLEQAGLVLARRIALPDHHDFADGLPLADSERGAVLLCTEKDATKLWPHHPGAWAVPLTLALAPGFWAALDGWLDARLSSRP